MSIQYKIKSLARHVANNTLGAVPRRAPAGAPDIIVFSNRRGGSTWLIELLSKEPDIKRAVEIFDVTLNHNPYRSVLPEDRGGFFFDLDDAGRQKLFRYFDDISSGRKNYNTQWKFWAQPYTTRYRRMLFKLFYVKNYIETFHQQYDSHVLLQLRHPVPTAMSINRLGWPSAIDSMGTNADFRRQLDDDQLTSIDAILAKGTSLEKHIAGWFLENFIPMRYAEDKDLLTVTYESMVRDPEATLTLLSDRLSLNLPDNARDDYRKPSYNAFDSAERIKTASPDDLCDGWKKRFDVAEHKLTEQIFAAFANPFYSLD